ncbi:MAG TPA: HAD family phosphatase [Steroidobacteraceae bacterium]|nr:HAD family phosphatase [Steroidobacteraceae bacterium]
MRNVILDLGGVVLDWNPDAILEGYYTDPGARAAMKSALFKHPDWLQLDRGTLSESEVLERLQQRTGSPEHELRGLFEAIRNSLKPKADTVALLKSLAKRRVPLYCLSNMAASTFEYLRERHAFWDAFRGIVISGEIKMAKPEREIFEYLLHRYALSAGETVFVDDHPPNIQAAQKLGLHTVWFRDAAQCAQELERLLAAE